MAKSKKMSRKARKTPSSTKKILIKRKAKRIVCVGCGSILGGVKSSGHASLSEKVPSRKFAGNLCHSCVRMKISQMVRQGV